MNLFELLYLVAAIGCSVIGAAIFGHHGAAAGIAGALGGFAAPFLIGQIICWIDDIRFSRTREGRRRSIAEDIFDRTFEERRISSWRARPKKGRDGSTIVTIYYGRTRPPRREFFRFDGDSMAPEQISGDEARAFIDVPLMR